jgi:hypothetical protein
MVLNVFVRAITAKSLLIEKEEKYIKCHIKEYLMSFQPGRSYTIRDS